MVIFHCSVSLPEGNPWGNGKILGVFVARLLTRSNKCSTSIKIIKGFGVSTSLSRNIIEILVPPNAQAPKNDWIELRCSTPLLCTGVPVNGIKYTCNHVHNVWSCHLVLISSGWLNEAIYGNMSKLFKTIVFHPLFLKKNDPAAPATRHRGKVWLAALGSRRPPQRVKGGWIHKVEG